MSSILPKRNNSRKTFLWVAVVALSINKVFQPFLLPFGPAAEIPSKNRPVYAKIDPSNDSLRFKHGKSQKIYERIGDDDSKEEALLKGPETVVFGNDGTMYVLTEEAKLISLTDFQNKDDFTITAKTTKVADLGVGRPLGGKFTTDNTLYMGDAVLGLTRIKDPQHDPFAKVELVASQVWDNGVLTPILFADDVVVGPKTGKIYFSDATVIPPDRVEGTWDVLYASKVDAMIGRRTGRLLQYDPSTDEVTVLARNLWFANGVSVDKDETFVVVCETFTMNLQMYHLSGPKQGTTEVMVDSVSSPGFFDGVDCNWSDGQRCYIALPSSVIPAMKLLWALPHPIDMILRTLLLMAPRSISPEPDDYGGILEVDPTTRETRIIQDPTGSDIGRITGVTVHDNKVYLGSLKNDYVGVYSI